MVLMEVEHEVWIMFGIRSFILLSGVFLALTGNSYSHEKEVLMWYTRRSSDKRQIAHPAWWYLNCDPFLKGEVCFYTLKKIITIGFECTSGSPCSPSCCSGSCRCQMCVTPGFLSGLELWTWPIAFLVGLMRGYGTLVAKCFHHSLLPKHRNKLLLDCMMASYCSRERKKPASRRSFLKVRRVIPSMDRWDGPLFIFMLPASLPRGKNKQRLCFQLAIPPANFDLTWIPWYNMQSMSGNFICY